MVFHFRAGFGFCDFFDVLLVGLLQHKGMENEIFFFFDLMESIECDLALLGTLNSMTPR